MALLERERVALEAGDPGAIDACVAEKDRLMSAFDGVAIPEDSARAIAEQNRRNGLLARSGLRLVRQVLGTDKVGYGPQRSAASAGGHLSKQA